MNPPAAAGVAEGAGRGVGIIGSRGAELAVAGGVESVCISCVNPLAAAGAAGASGAGGSVVSGGLPCSWFRVFSSCVNPPCAAGVGGALGGALNCSALAGAGSGRKDGYGSGLDAGDPALENICVKEPGSELAGGAAGADSRGAMVCIMRVNSPGPAAGAGAGGAENAGVADGTGGAGVSLNAPNICVKLPGEEGAAAAGGGAGAAGIANLPEGPAASGFFSIETWTNALASSRDAFIGAAEPEPAPGAGVLSACSMRVNSPGLLPCASGAGGGVGAAGAGGADENTGACAGGAGTGGAGAAGAAKAGDAGAEKAGDAGGA